MLTWVAKWRGRKELIDGSLMRDGKRRMLKRMHGLLEDADAVVTWNGNGFDLKILNKEFLLHGMAPPAPYKSVDLLSTSRDKFRFTSNKLDYIAQQLGLGCKVKNRGHELWLDCMNRKASAFAEMLVYNRQDVVLLEKIYDKFLPWVKGHPNAALYAGEGGRICPHCGGKKIQRRGTIYTQTQAFHSWQCRTAGCFKWSRSRRADPTVGRPELVAA